MENTEILRRVYLGAVLSCIFGPRKSKFKAHTAEFQVVVRVETVTFTSLSLSYILEESVFFKISLQSYNQRFLYAWIPVSPWSMLKVMYLPGCTSNLL